jgi:hypothetical protein
MSWRRFRQAPAGMQVKCLALPAGLLFSFARLHFCGMDKQKIRERRERRQQFLRTLYEEVDGSVNEFVDGLELASGLGADVAEGRRIIAYLEEKGLLKVDDHKAGIIRITADGVDAVETE